MDVGPACQPRSPLAFPSGGWATFPMLGMFPHTHGHRQWVGIDGGGRRWAGRRRAKGEKLGQL